MKRLLALLICQLIAVSFFCAGFFPRKKVLKGDSDFKLQVALQKEAKPVFDKLIVVVIDALRSDFVFEESNSKFFFVHSLLNEGNAWGFTAYSNPPTVTLPRLKGITTGSTPNFLDAILNVAEDDSSSNLDEEDSWIRQLYKHDKKIRFFGDDTWLKLFPLEYFDEYEGTNSFFVSDFEQVDNNVTRHLPKQLASQKDWDVLIFHYLGLDHIGHKGGSRSQFMPAKQVEMDSIIKKIYETVDDNTLICVLGDHGMNDVGNHGGSSPGETSAALVLMSKKLKNYEVPSKQESAHLPVKETSNDSNYQYLTPIQQVDIVPTLATLLNFPIPKNSVGIIIRETLQLLDPKVARVKIKENYHQLISILAGNANTRPALDFEDMSPVFKDMKNIQNELTRSATNYNYLHLGVGLSLLIITSVFTVLFGLKQIKYRPFFFLTLIVSLLIGLSTFGSSFVEEEHQIWWWIVTGSILVSATYLTNEKSIHLLIFICVRLIRGWNNSGQKYAHEHTVFEILKRNPTAQWYLNFLTIFSLGLTGSTDSLLSFTASFLLSTLCLVYKTSWAIVNREKVPKWMYEIAFKSSSAIVVDDDNVFEKALIPLARLFFQCLVGSIVARLVATKWGLVRPSKRLGVICSYITLLLIFQSPSPNIPLFLIFDILRRSLERLLSTQYESNACLVSVISLILQYFTFFQFGGTNSIATVDLSNAYNGVSENYNIYVVGFMMCVSNFAPSIYWSMLAWRLLYDGKEKWSRFSKNKLTFLIFNCVSGCCLLMACVSLRFHLFIWSVFSPKLCYYATWNIFMNLTIGWILESVIIFFN